MPRQRNVFVPLPNGQSLTVLKALGPRPNHGYNLVKETGFKPSSIYTSLTRLEGSGFISGATEDRPHKGSPFPRRLYTITRLGKDALDQIQPKKK